jgi:hypothetical protein
VEIRFTTTPQVLYGAQRAIAREIPWLRWSGLFVVVAFPLLMIGLTLAYGGTALGALRANWVTIVGLPLFWLVSMPVLQRWTAGRTLRNTPSLQGEQVYRVGPAGLRLENAVSATDIGWGALVRVTETRGFFLLFQSKAMALFIPKHAFGSGAEVEQFRGLVADGVGARASWSARVQPGVAAT